MAAHFNFDGLSIERFYHFVCKADTSTFALLEELGLSDRMRWRTTTMGYFIDGKLSNGATRLRSSSSRASACRLGCAMVCLLSSSRAAIAGTRLRHQSARDWIMRWGGAEIYDRLWKRLLELKFHEYADNISAAWIWTRVKRVGRSRKSLFHEELGYIEGGSQTLVNALCGAIESLGGQIRVSTPAIGYFPPVDASPAWKRPEVFRICRRGHFDDPDPAGFRDRP